jgi:hypothetical protein
MEPLSFFRLQRIAQVYGDALFVEEIIEVYLSAPRYLELLVSNEPAHASSAIPA